MNRELIYVKKWLDANKSALNIEKTNFVLFHSVVQKITEPIELSRKLSRSVAIFYSLRHFAPKETLKTVYYSLFYSFLSYGIVVWGGTHEKYLKPVFISQKEL